MDRAMARIVDLPLLRTAMMSGAAQELVPDKLIRCYMGCGAEMKVCDYQTHESLECPNRKLMHDVKISVPVIGGYPDEVVYTVGVRLADQDHFEEVKEQLRRAVVTWNVARIADALDHGVGPDHHRFNLKVCKCEGCVMPLDMVRACEGRLRRLQAKVRAVEPICRKGNIKVDYDNCAVLIQKTIPFCNRKPPDTSAEIQPDALADTNEVLTDLAVVLRAFMEPMVIEGHTGGETPPEYWTELATNRAKYIVDFLVKQGVRKDLVIAKGCPGGGAKVLVYPMTKEA